MAEPRATTSALARKNREGRRLKNALNNQFEKSEPSYSAITMGRNLVAIGGQIYPAEGVEGQGAAVAVRNVGTPAVARYAPDNRRSVVSVSGTGRGGGSGGGGGELGPHYLHNREIHLGLLDWDQLNKTGSNLADLAIRSHASLTNITADDHHNQVHSLVGSDHTASGLTAGHVVRASGPTTFAWAQLQHDDLGGITPNQHHARAHDIITGDDSGAVHTIVGNTFDLVGAIAPNTLGLLTPSSNPGASARILRTDTSGSLQLDTNLLSVDAENNAIGINRIPAGAALDVMAYSDADHTLRVKQKAGQLGRLWRVEDTDGKELIVLDSQGNLQSGKPGFVSGLTGWQITPEGIAEFLNGYFRGELHATVLVRDEIHASAGTWLIATAAKIYEDSEIDSTTTDVEYLEIETTVEGFGDYLEIESTSASYDGDYLEVEAILNYIFVEDPPSGPGLYFSTGDVLRSKTEVPAGITDQWFTVRNARQMDGFSRYSVTKESGLDHTLTAGTAIVSWGQVGDGRILMTSDLNHAPYIDVFSVGPQPWTGSAGSIIPHVRLGQLSGVGVTAVSGISQFGIIGGTDLSDANSPYLVASNLQLRLHKVNLTANDGIHDTVELTSTGNLKLGTNIGTTAGTSFHVETTGPNAGDVTIGRADLGTNYLHWDQDLGTLRVKGDLIIEGSSYLTPTSPTITDLQNAVNTTLPNSIAAAQTNAQNYANARRVIGVSGTWSSPNGNTVSWSSLSVRLGNGTTKMIASGMASGMPGRTYLYVDTSNSNPDVMLTTPNPNSLGTNHSLIAVADPGADKASVSVVAGSTYISGDNIMTGSISANQIKSASITGDKIAANTITANHIVVGELATITARTGHLTVDPSGSIKSTGKDTYGSGTPGFFLGYDTSGGVPAYKFGLGDSNNRLTWDGAALTLVTNRALGINTSDAGMFLNVSRPSHSATLWLEENGVVRLAGSGTPALNVDGQLNANKLINTGNTFQIMQRRTIASASEAGFEGEICWDNNFIYVCVANVGSKWRRAPISLWS